MLQTTDANYDGASSLEWGAGLAQDWNIPTALGIALAVLAILAAGPLRKQLQTILENLGIPRSWIYIFEPRDPAPIDTSSQRLGIRIGQLFVDRPLPLNQIKGEYEPAWTKRPPEIDQRSAAEVGAAIAQAHQLGRTLDNNASYDLRRISVSRPQEGREGRKNQYLIQFRPTDFHSFVFPNLRAYELLKSDKSAAVALRDQADIAPEKLAIDELERLQARFRTGTNTVAVTYDGKVILSVRSRRQLMATGGNLSGDAQPVFRLHTSAPEGMTRTDPSGGEEDDLLGGQPHPGATSLRALKKELGLVEGRHFGADRLMCLGWYMDLLRSEPQFVFFVRLRATAAEVCALWDEGTEDAHENLSICCVPWKIENVARAFRQEPFSSLEAIVPSKDRDLFQNAISARSEWSSNHAKTSMLIAALHQFGSRAVHDHISLAIAKVDQTPTN